MSHWTTSGRSRLKAKQKSSFAQEAQMRANAVATEWMAVPHRPPTTSHYPPTAAGMTRKHRYSYGNPIARRGLAVPIGRHNHHHLELIASHGPQAMMPAQVVPPIQNFRRIRDPNATRYQPHPKQATPVYAPRMGLARWPQDTSPVRYDHQPQEEGVYHFQQQPPDNHQYYHRPAEAVRYYRSLHDEPEWGEPSLAPSLTSIEFSGQDIAHPLHRQPQPRLMPKPRGIARFKRKAEMDDMEAAEAAWDQVNEISIAIDTESFDPPVQQHDPPATSRNVVQPHPGFSTQNRFSSLSHEGEIGAFLPGEALGLPNRPPSDRRQSRFVPTIQIPLQRDGPEYWEPRVPSAPRHQSCHRRRAGKPFSFDSVGSGTPSNGWEHLDDSQGALLRFQRVAQENGGVPPRQTSKEFVVNAAASHSQNNRNESAWPSGATTGLDRCLHKAPVDVVEFPPLRFFDSNMEVDADGNPFSQPGSQPSKRLKSDVLLTENAPTKKDLFDHSFENR